MRCHALKLAKKYHMQTQFAMLAFESDILQRDIPWLPPRTLEYMDVPHSL